MFMMVPVIGLILYKSLLHNVFEPNRWIRGCLGQTAQFSVSHTALNHFYLY